MKSIKELLGLSNVHPALKLQLKQNISDPWLEDCVLASPEIAVIASARHDYSSGGGVARYSILRVLYKDEVQMKEWQYCDKWSHLKNRWDLMILNIGETKVKEVSEEIMVRVQCLPPKGHAPRLESFKFKKKDDVAMVAHMELPENMQEEFKQWAGQERSRILNQMLKIWKQNTRIVLTPHGKESYAQPRIKEVRFIKAIGIGVIITEEQIDFDQLGNPQMQQKALVLKWKDRTVEMACEEHNQYIRGSANIDIISISAKEVIFGTQSGQKIVSL